MKEKSVANLMGEKRKKKKDKCSSDSGHVIKVKAHDSNSYLYTVFIAALFTVFIAALFTVAKR